MAEIFDAVAKNNISAFSSAIVRTYRNNLFAKSREYKSGQASPIQIAVVACEALLGISGLLHDEHGGLAPAHLVHLVFQHGELAGRQPLRQGDEEGALPHAAGNARCQ